MFATLVKNSVIQKFVFANNKLRRLSIFCAARHYWQKLIKAWQKYVPQINLYNKVISFPIITIS